MKTKPSSEPSAHAAGHQPGGSFDRHSNSWLANGRFHYLLAISLSLLLLLGTAHGAWNNGSFEMGSAGAAPPNWTVTTYLNKTGFTPQDPQTFAGLNLAAGGTVKTVILSSSSGPGSQPDATLGSSASLRWPRYGNQCVLVNQLGNLQNVNALSQTATMTAEDFDPVDGQLHIRFTIAYVMQNPDHTEVQQPYAFVQLVDLTQAGKTLYSHFPLPNSNDAAWQRVNAGTGSEIDYTDWTLIDVNGASSGIAVGDQVQLTVLASGCQPNAHFGEVYVDEVGAVPSGIFAEGTAAVQYPDADGLHDDIAYTVTYRNGGGIANTNAVCIFTTPANTTYLSASGNGLNFTGPGVGNAGTLSASIGTLAQGATGTLKVTVQAPAGTTSPVVAFNYGIFSDQATMLLGPDITPTVVAPLAISSTASSGGNFTLGFQNTSGLTFEVLYSGDLTTPVSSWTSLGYATEVNSGNYQFTSAMSGAQGFYRVRVVP